MNSLKIKILGLTTLIMLIAVALAVWHNFDTQQAMLQRFADQNGRVLGETIRNSIIANMASGQNSEVARILERISREPAIESVRIFDESGRILISADAEETGDLIAASDLLAYRSGNYSYIDDTSRTDHHTTLVPINNAPTCHRCHDPEAKVLGILNVHLSLSEMAMMQRKGRQATLLTSLGMAAIMIITLGGFILFYVDGPLRRFAVAMNFLEKGDFERARTKIRSSREMELLSEKFNLMVDRVKQLLDQTVHHEREMAIAEEKLSHHDEIRNMNITLEERLKEIEYLNITLEERIEEIEEANYKIADLAGELEDRNTNLEEAVSRLQALHKLGLSINATMDIERLFALLLHRTVETLQARVGYLLLLDRDSWTLKIGAAEGLPEHIDKGMRIPIKPGGVSHWVIKNNQALLISNIDESREFSRVSRLGFTRETVICTPLVIGEEVIGTLTMANRRDENPFDGEDLELLTTIAAQASIAIKNARLYEEQQSTYLSTVQALVSAVEASDAYTRGHSERVKRYALRLAEFMNLPAETLKRLEQAAILHDIGKIGICESLLHKTAKLDSEDIEILRQHPSIGVKILEPINFLSDVRAIIQQHHERYDGSGYPKGIAGNDLMLEARILAVADTYDAMTTDRPYRKALSHEVTIEEIRRNAGGQFDPDVAMAFIRMFEEEASAA
ncbi:HD domain-containing phosphohydrolase [Geothermobacter hydrogeniphilus]|uniref:HDIG domain-containing protein n=1 Tax=Geothermobacter hydrogeniphilus TaxID=1969733 RepID=A0A1X0Y356_9BACT|nr:HD domain-containing phosphohydrolase [Geothermobacter hydrogeniphilus]ORJ59502.1 hypothetical protein B5V00_09460 [Geothermobacter hydrogeniphilus]